jgi:ribosomal protein S18 acetylase RimI-like enzyme
MPTRSLTVRSTRSSPTGTALLDSALAGARRNGHEYVWLTVWEHNRPARAAYAAWGFEDLGPIPFEFAGLQQTDRLMVLPTGLRSAAVSTKAVS